MLLSLPVLHIQIAGRAAIQLHALQLPNVPLTTNPLKIPFWAHPDNELADANVFGPSASKLLTIYRTATRRVNATNRQILERNFCSTSFSGNTTTSQSSSIDVLQQRSVPTAVGARVDAHLRPTRKDQASRSVHTKKSLEWLKMLRFWGAVEEVCLSSLFRFVFCRRRRPSAALARVLVQVKTQ